MKLAVGDEALLVAAAEVKDFRVGAFALDAVHLKSPRHIQFALAATVLALRDAGISLPDARKRKPLVALAYPMAERRSFEEPLKRGSAGEVELNRAEEAVINFVCAQGGGRNGRRFYSSIEAVGFAAECVARGEVDLAICGGADAPLTSEILAEMKRFGLSPGHAKEPERVCRPFDLWRTTGVAGEGACLFVLEPEHSPQRAHARVAGSAQAQERGDRPWETLDEAVRLALGNAGLRPGAIDCIHADGTGHKLLDYAEANVLREWLGSRLDAVPVVSIKGAIGNALGAAGAIQIGCAALGIRHSTIPPTVNWRHPDPSCPLNLSGSSRLLAMAATLVVGRDGAGSVASLILKP